MYRTIYLSNDIKVRECFHLNTQYIDDRYPSFHTSREEYVKKARESCLKNYYGDQMPSREVILKEIEEKRAREEALKRQKEQIASEGMTSTVIPFDEGRWNQAKNRTLEREERPMMVKGEKLDANSINRRLQSGISQPSPISEATITLPVRELELSQGSPMSKKYVNIEDEKYLPSIMEQLPVVEPEEQNIPSANDILKMSGIEETTENRIENENYVEEYKSNYYPNQTTNFVTSIQNAEPEKVERKRKVHSPEELKSYRLFGIRCFCAFAILLALIVLDKMSIQYDEITPRSIYQQMMSSELADGIETWVMETIKK